MQIQVKKKRKRKRIAHAYVSKLSLWKAVVMGNASLPAAGAKG
jgi:hypothetical protein